MFRLLFVCGVLVAFCGGHVGPAAHADADGDNLGGSLKIEQDGRAVRIARDGRPILEYRFSGVPAKPYVRQLLTPDGRQVLRDAPEDHPHHHGLMFAVGVEGVSFWAETDTSGRQVHRGFGPLRASTTNGRGTAILHEKLAWLPADSDKPLLLEERQIVVHADSGIPATLLSWRTRLHVPRGGEPVRLTGSHYYGLGVRFASSMDRATRFITESGEQGDVVRGEERLVGSKWCAAVGPVDGKAVTVAVFDHPDNPHFPGPKFTMPSPFAYLSATLNLWKEPLEVRQDRPLECRFGVAAFDGEASEEEIAKVYAFWLRQNGDR